ncbi:MAG: hypothetical protein IKI09_11550 [Bacteroidales bacterium]|nr:hypothetical protein [Bacteroidales bacterium]
MVQPRAYQPVAQAVYELAAGHRGRNAARKAACGYHRRLVCIAHLTRDGAPVGLSHCGSRMETHAAATV